MTALSDTLEQLNHLYVRTPIRIRTLGQFSVWRNDTLLSSKEFGRDKTIQLLQYLISYRSRNALHKEKIMDDLWEDWSVVILK